MIWSSSMKKTSLLFVCAILASNVAVADDIENQVFSKIIPGEIEELSDQEMESTKGEWGVPGAIAGAAIGTWGYAGFLATGGEFSYGSAFQSIVGGGILGGFAGPGSVATRYTMQRTAASVGAVGGIMDSVPKRTLSRPATSVPNPFAR